MSIATELQDLNDNILDAYSAVQTKGGTVPAHKNMENLDDAITSIPSGGGSPYDIPRGKIVYSGRNTLAVPFLGQSETFTIPNDIEVIGPFALAYAFYGFVTGNLHGGVYAVDLNNVEEVMTSGMLGFAGRTSNTGATSSITANNLTTAGTEAFHSAFSYFGGSTISFPKLSTAGQQSFQNAFSNARNNNGITASFPELTTAGYEAFKQCFNTSFSIKGIVSASFPKLTTAGSYCFQQVFSGVTALDSVNFEKLNSAGSYCFNEAFPNTSSSTITTVNFPELTEAGDRAFNTAFRTPSITTVTFPELATLGVNCFQSAFTGCNIGSISFPKVENVPNYGFSNAFYKTSNHGVLQSASFPKVTSVGSGGFSYAFSGQATITSVGGAGCDVSIPLIATGTQGSFDYMFQNCTSLSTATFPALASITGTTRGLSYVFKGCTSLTTVTFPMLSSIPQSTACYYMFQNCTSLSSVSFPALTTSSFGSYNNQFSNMLRGCTGVTVHFPAAIQSTIGNWSDVTNGFGGTNTTVLFDL